MLFKNLALFLLGSCCAYAVLAQNNSLAVIPQPVKAEKKEGVWILNTNTILELDKKNRQVVSIAEYLTAKLSPTLGKALPLMQEKESADPAAKRIHLQLIDEARAKWMGTEGYQLDVNAAGVTLQALQPAGLFYGVQTLLQLLPKEIESRDRISRTEWELPQCHIEDYPRFGWRGLMLDVSRHFFTKEEVLRFIDDMVRYKFNLLHLHLTDDQGWRIEIKSLPRLTSVGAWRVPRVGRMSMMTPPAPDEPKTYGGFYTQDDIKEIIQYAQSRYVNVMPEVDIPGHSMALVAAYPELSCTPGAYRVNSGERFMNWTGGGNFSALIDNTLCPTNEKVYEVLDQVFTEIAGLFPFGYIHMGGDECAKNFWAKSEAIKSLQQREGLKDLHEVQSYFVKRIEKIILAKGKKMMGWDEILEGGLAPSAAVMSWRGEKGGIEASNMQHPVVMSPTTYAYLDYNQGEAYVEPPVHASLRLKKSYQFNPIPEGADAKFILGGQANIWTEQIPNFRALQYMTWPRGMAIAESVWSPQEVKNWELFSRRVELHLERLEMAETKAARTIYDPIITCKKSDDGQVRITLETELSDLDIYYSFDETHPDRFYPKYTQPLTIPKDALSLKLITYRNRQKMGRQIDLPVTEIKRRAGVK